MAESRGRYTDPAGAAAVPPPAVPLAKGGVIGPPPEAASSTEPDDGPSPWLVPSTSDRGFTSLPPLYCHGGTMYVQAKREAQVDTGRRPVRHHAVSTRSPEGAVYVARPLRDTSWWHRWKQERACRKGTGHCWHPEGLIDWWCCMCSAETDGMPEQECVHCLKAAADG
jgi:hypothetical protein